MTPRAMAGVLAISLAVVHLARGNVMAQQPAPPRDARPQPAPGSASPSGTGELGGVVTSDDGQPLRSAYVVLIGSTTGVVKISSTDGDGRFAFAGLPADRFTVGASKPPYLGAIAGAKRPARPGVPVALLNGQRITNVSIRLPMGAAISGVITDERGQPLSNAIAALQQWKMQGTDRALVQVGTGTATDDRGAYRFFGLTPGEYVITATRSGPPQAPRALTANDVDAALRTGVAGSAPATSPVAPQRYAAAYFPGTSRVTDAQPVLVGEGEERRNIDFRVEPVQTARVDGMVVTTTGQLPPGTVVQFRSAGGGAQSVAIASPSPDGRFVLPSALPGSYRLLVSGNGPLAGQFATADLEVAGVDISGVQLTMRPALTFSGTLVFQGETAGPALTGRRIPLRMLGANGAAGTQPQVSATNPTGLFTVTNVMPGRYLVGGPLALGPTSDTLNWVLQSVTIDGRDVTDLPVEIADAPPKNVVVTYGDKWQGLSGRFQSSSGTPVSDVTVVVFPEDKAYWFQGSRRIVTARPDTDGRFVVSGQGPTTLPPGRYLLATVTDLGRDEQFDPAFLSALVPGAVPIALQLGEKKSQDLAVK